MSRQRRRDTAPEVALRRELHRRGLRFFVDRAPLPGLRRRADLVFPRRHLAVYVDGCFWHRCPVHATDPKNNSEWWAAKLAGNVLRGEDAFDSLLAQSLRGIDAEDLRPRMIREPQSRVQHSRDPHVIDVGTPPDGEIASLVLDAGASDAARKLYVHFGACGEELDRIENLHVARAAAEVRSEKAGRFGTGDARASRVEERLRPHDDSRSAEAALERSLRGEGVGEAIELLRVDALEGLDLLACGGVQRLRAARDGSSLDQDRAAAALARGRAPVFRRDHAQLFAERGEKMRMAALDFYFLAVEGESRHAGSSFGGTAPRRSVMSRYWSGLR